MRILKRLAPLAVAATVLASSTTVFAATQADVVKALKGAGVPEVYVIKAENYFKTNTLTEAQSSAVVAEVNEAKDIVQKAKATDFNNLSQKDKDAILDAVKSAASVANLNVNVSKDASGKVIVTLVDAKGQTVVSASANELDLKKTGNDSTVLVLGSFMVIAAAGSLLVVRKVTA